MAVKPRVAMGEGKNAGPAGAGACCGEETAVVEPSGNGAATPGVDWT